MESLAKNFGGRVDFYMLYVREPHPGENYFEHESFEQKLQYARDLKRLEHIERPVLVDDIKGDMHTHYGMMPNSVYVIGKDGIVSYRAQWSEPATLEAHLNELLSRNGHGAEVRPINIIDNLVTLTPHELWTEFRVLRRAGFRSMADFTVQIPNLLWPRLRSQLFGAGGRREEPAP